MVPLLISLTTYETFYGIKEDAADKKEDAEKKEDSSEDSDSDEVCSII